MYNILIVAGDPGGANALDPVINLLYQKSDFNIHLFGYNEAYDAWSEKYESVNRIPLSADDSYFIRSLSELEIDVVLTGTSWNDYVFERNFILEGNKLGIITISLLDFWTAYRSRFFGDSDDINLLPERIAIMDDLCFKQMIAEGFDKNRLVITGQPAFDKLNLLVSDFTKEKKKILLDYYNIDEGTIIVSFASQPISELYQNHNLSLSNYGFTELDVIESVIECLELISKKNTLDIKLMICPHPREEIGKFIRFKSENVLIFKPRQIVSDFNTLSSKDLMLCSDCVIGMNSILLIESCYMKKIAISFQPGLLLDDPLPTNKLGYTIPVYDEKDLQDVLFRYIFDQSKKEEHINKLNKLFGPNSSAKNVEILITSQLSNRNL